ncbi:MAG TPA: 2Fe-2S iron-sulfur cluster-binding protein [Myxococcaceae bacterium]|nr:2Fe-2S iron-sulfur cluster-binding protein [Myxococcaceae bacterium]
MPRVRFRSPFDEVVIEVPEGTSLLEAAEQCGATVGHACGGVCACSTCHVWVRRGLESLSEQEDAEADRLDQAFDVRSYSRLSCQSLVGNEDVDVDITQESLQAFLDENPELRHRLESEGKWPLKR